MTSNVKAMLNPKQTNKFTVLPMVFILSTQDRDRHGFQVMYGWCITCSDEHTWVALSQFHCGFEGKVYI